MRRLIQIVLLFYCYYLAHCDPPYFPSQIVFTINNGKQLYAIDAVNQRAFVSINDSSPQSAYVFQHFPYSPADTPQSKYYVQLATALDSKTCAYGTYWEYGGNPYNYFPAHWNTNTSFQITNYLHLNYQMVHSNNHSEVDEDYWYSDQVCSGAIPDIQPCFRIYFKRNTDIPLRSIELQTVAGRPIFQTTKYEVLSTGKPDDKYFSGIPRNWYTSCLDINLQVKYLIDNYRIGYESYKTVGVSLSTPPHKINGNDSVIISWSIISGCHDCLTWTPQKLTFNHQNFNQIQNLTIYRVFDSIDVIFSPSFIGGGFDLVSPAFNSIHFLPA